MRHRRIQSVGVLALQQRGNGYSSESVRSRQKNNSDGSSHQRREGSHDPGPVVELEKNRCEPDLRSWKVAGKRAGVLGQRAEGMCWTNCALSTLCVSARGPCCSREATS